jgi:hypothetical protein
MRTKVFRRSSLTPRDLSPGQQACGGEIYNRRNFVSIRVRSSFIPAAHVTCIDPTMNVPSPTELPVSETDDAIYDRGFWLAYAANLMLVCANCLTFHFADFIASLGGTEELSGEIVRSGLIAAIVCRLWLGRAIDHFGTRAIWLASSAVYIAGGMAFLLPDRLSSIIALTGSRNVCSN